MGDKRENEKLTSFTIPLDEEVTSLLSCAFGQKYLRRVLQAITFPPQTTHLRVNTTKASREEVIAALSSCLQEFKDRIQETEREILDPYPHPVLDDCICIPHVPPKYSPNEWHFIDDGSGHRVVILDRACGEAVLRGSDVFACGVMCAGQYIKPGQQVDVYVDLEGTTTRGLDVREYKKRKLHVGTGIMQMSRTEVFQTMRGLALKMTEVITGDAPPTNGMLYSKIYSQNLSSMIVAHVLKPEPGEVVIDLCSAPGGKATHIAQRMGDTGLVVACDRTLKKAEHIRQLCKELELSCVVPLCFDSRDAVVKGEIADQRTPPQEVIKSARIGRKQFRDVPAFFPETFDHVVLDPPCSALGLRPKLRCDLKMKELQSHVNLQRQLFWGAVHLLKPGGTLVYSTCTINPLENEGMVGWVLNNYPCLTLEDQDPRIGGFGLPGCGLNESQRKLVQRFDPSSSNSPSDSTTGFFCAKFIKTTGQSV
mmetsp:Transcript_32899/g.42048  ORF Transcript_32899/g.42048 Transcript_32899/m.42048 type:complete len:480 (+) Transcript_32899:151-1590(+)